jgi:U2 small nuclear ribonucleoprotein B''
VAKKDGTFHQREKRKREQPDSTETQLERPAKAIKLIVNEVPHNILFAQALPDDCTEHVLSMVFQQQCSGFKEVRMVPGKKGLAFIDFQDEIQAGMALSQLNGFSLSATEQLHLTYANK